MKRTSALLVAILLGLALLIGGISPVNAAKAKKIKPTPAPHPTLAIDPTNQVPPCLETKPYICP